MGQTKTFISYAADDPDWPARLVRSIGQELRERGAEVFLDQFHDEGLKSPPSISEWIEWMRTAATEADRVICLASARYLALSKRELDDPRGYGVAYETLSLLNKLYFSKGRNEGRILVIRHDGAAVSSTVHPDMQHTCSLLEWPRQRERLLVAAAGTRATESHGVDALRDGAASNSATSSDSSDAPDTDTLQAQRKLVEDRLKAAEPLWRALCSDDWDHERPTGQTLLSVASFARWLASSSAPEAGGAMWAVHRALLALRDDNKVRADARLMRAAELATVAVYCLALCRHVNVDVLGAGLRFPRNVKHAAHLYCAVIATVLAGGRLELVATERAEVPRPLHAYDIVVPAAGDHREQVFERAVYQALFSASKFATTDSLDDGPLAPEQRSRLVQRLKTIRRAHRQSLSLVVHVDALYPPADNFARSFQVPVFVCGDDVATPLVGMGADELVAAITELWDELHHCKTVEPGVAPAAAGEQAANPAQTSASRTVAD